ncbi:uncharacterized protein [Watersipora subatra]|uniref:uncharacterized protein n=1 Tax=Watersipora subatra TaxID=2589382 RepID=UPI00355BDF11
MSISNVSVADKISHEIILGTDFLAKLGEVAYNFDKCTIRVNGETLPMDNKAVKACTVSRTDHMVCAVKAVHNTELPPFSETLVEAQVKSSNIDRRDCIIERDSKAGSRRVIMGKSVCKVDRENIRIPVMNAGPSSYTLQKGTFVDNVETSKQDLPLLNLKSVPAKTKESTNPGDTLKQEDTDLTDSEMGRLRKLINNFSDIIGENVSELGRTNIVEHVIETVPGATTVRSRPYIIPVHLKAEVKSQIDKMLEHGLIRMSTGNWSSPIVLVKKKDGS